MVPCIIMEKMEGITVLHKYLIALFVNNHAGDRGGALNNAGGGGASNLH